MHRTGPKDELERMADQILASAPKPSDYTIINDNRMKDIRRHELGLGDMDDVPTISKEDRVDRVTEKHRRRKAQSNGDTTRRNRGGETP